MARVAVARVAAARVAEEKAAETEGVGGRGAAKPPEAAMEVVMTEAGREVVREREW